MKYRIERWLPPYLGPDEVQELSGRYAKYEAALILIEYPEALVKVESLDSGRRFLAKVRAEGVVLERLPDDGIPNTSAADVAQDRRDKFLARVFAEEQRMGKKARAKAAGKRQRREKFGKGVNRPVVCIDFARAFLSVAEAAEWNGVKRQSLQAAIAKGKRCRRLRFQYAAELLKELNDERDRVHRAKSSMGGPDSIRDLLSWERAACRPNHAALRQAAESTLLLQERAEVQEVPRPARIVPGGGVAI